MCTNICIYVEHHITIISNQLFSRKPAEQHIFTPQINKATAHFLSKEEWKLNLQNLGI